MVGRHHCVRQEHGIDNRCALGYEWMVHLTCTWRPITPTNPRHPGQTTPRLECIAAATASLGIIHIYWSPCAYLNNEHGRVDSQRVGVPSGVNCT